MTCSVENASVFVIHFTSEDVCLFISTNADFYCWCGPLCCLPVRVVEQNLAMLLGMNGGGGGGGGGGAGADSSGGSAQLSGSIPTPAGERWRGGTGRFGMPSFVAAWPDGVD